MTTGAMVLGAVPLALASGAGAESRRQIGMVIVGGMTLGTLLTLFVVPTVYTLLARRRRVAGSPVMTTGDHGEPSAVSTQPAGGTAAVPAAGSAAAGS
jgi:multidrug efflux pump